jgi:hypothetical protein
MKINSSFKNMVLALALLVLALAACSALQPEAKEPGIITGRVYLDEDADAECDICDCDFYLEGIEIQLYEGNCGGTIHQMTETDAEGVFNFPNLPPGNYCISPKVKTICEGYQPTTPIQQKVELSTGETVEVPWFGFDHNLDFQPEN